MVRVGISTRPARPPYQQNPEITCRSQRWPCPPAGGGRRTARRLGAPSSKRRAHTPTWLRRHPLGKQSASSAISYRLWAVGPHRSPTARLVDAACAGRDIISPHLGLSTLAESLADRHAKAKLVVAASVVQLGRQQEVDADVDALLKVRGDLFVREKGLQSSRGCRALPPGWQRPVRPLVAGGCPTPGGGGGFVQGVCGARPGRVACCRTL